MGNSGSESGVGEEHAEDDLERDGRDTDAESLTYLRALYADVLSWYGVADSKAQVILTLNGVIIAFSSSNLLAGEEATWAGWARVLPWGAALCLAGALYFAIDALHSNLLDASLRSPALGLGLDGPDPDAPEKGWWFGHLATLSRTAQEARAASRRNSLMMYLPSRLNWLTPAPSGSREKDVESMLLRISTKEERRVLSSEIVVLSVHVLEKHRAVNRGWVASGLALILILLAAATAQPLAVSP